MTKPLPTPDDELWSDDIGKNGSIHMIAEERRDRPGVVRLRWWDAAKKNNTSETVPMGLRSEKGRISKERVSAIRRFAAKRLKELGAASPTEAGESVGKERASAPPPMADPKTTLTIEDGCRMALALRTGIFAAATTHYKDLSREIGRMQEKFAPDATWATVEPKHYQDAWRSLLADFIASRRAAMKANNESLTVGGVRSIEMSVIGMIRVRHWLEEGGSIPRGAAPPPRNWGVLFETDVRNMIAEAEKKSPLGLPARDRKPRHTKSELGLLLISMGQADCRLGLLMELALEARHGQVLQLKRSMLELSGGVRGLGFVVVPGAGKKLGVRVDFDHQQHDAVSAALSSGYLNVLEAAFRAGRIADFPLFPKDPKTLRPLEMRPASRRSLLEWFTALEETAGIPKMANRGLYGMRRAATDLANSIERDRRVLDALTGHTPEGTRSREYLNPLDEEVLEAVVVARRALRDRAIALGQAAIAARGVHA